MPKRVPVRAVSGEEQGELERLSLPSSYSYSCMVSFDDGSIRYFSIPSCPTDYEPEHAVRGSL